MKDAERAASDPFDLGLLSPGGGMLRAQQVTQLIQQFLGLKWAAGSIFLGRKKEYNAVGIQTGRVSSSA